jgi:hypothetical protein
MMNEGVLSREASPCRCEYRKRGYVGSLTITGILTDECLQEINVHLQRAMTGSDFVVINIDELHGMSDEFFSILCAAARTAYNGNKRLHLGRATSEQQIEASYMCSSKVSRSELPGCAAHCFWMNQTAEQGQNLMSDSRGN